MIVLYWRVAISYDCIPEQVQLFWWPLAISHFIADIAQRLELGIPAPADGSKADRMKCRHL